MRRRPLRSALCVLAAGIGLVAPVSPARAAAPQPASATQVPASAASGSPEQRLGLGRDEKLTVRSVVTDPDGTRHTRYDRRYKGLPVYGGDLIERADRSGHVIGVTWGSRMRGAMPALATTPRITEAQAVNAAPPARGAAVRARATSLAIWLDHSQVPRKVTPARLVREVVTESTRADHTPSRVHTLVDATTGARVVSWDDIKAAGNGSSRYSGQVTIDTLRNGAGTWDLADSSGATVVDMGHSTSGSGTLMTDADNLWGFGSSQTSQGAGVDALFGSEQTMRYYRDVLGRNGIWDDGRGAPSRVHYDTNYDNAFWDGTQMTYGDGVNNAMPFTALDIAAHEMSHGVTENTANLFYAGESGGLNEATSDIFATGTEFHTNAAADTPDYMLGERLNYFGTGEPLRHMDRPSRDGVSLDCWGPSMGTEDVHYTSGPLNHWYYLASEGSGAKTINGVAYNSPTCNGKAVTGAGHTAIEKVWYRALSTRLTSSSGYRDARDASIRSAVELYGTNSQVCRSVESAFDGIGVPGGFATCAGERAAPANACTETVTNGGFESGQVGWGGDTSTITDSALMTPRSGRWYAWLGGWGKNRTETLSRTMTLPRDRPQLAYELLGATEETTTSADNDVFTVTLTTGSGSTVQLDRQTNRTANPTYQRRTSDLSAYAGQTVTVSFTSAENSSLSTSWLVDEVSVRSRITPYAAQNPQRVLDTRTGTGARVGVVRGGSYVDVTLPANVAGSKAVSLNVGAVTPAGSGYLTLYDAARPRPVVSSLNYQRGRTVANAATVTTGGTLRVFASADTDVIIDLVGAHPAGSRYVPVTPTRLEDTRGGAPVPADTAHDVGVAGRAGIPGSGVAAVVSNATVVAPDRAGWLTLWPSGAARPNTSNLNYAAGSDTAGAALAAPGAAGAVSMRPSASSHLLLDVAGYLPACGDFASVAPARLVDTRLGTGAPKARVPAGGSLQVRVTGTAGVPVMPVNAVALTVTAVGPGTEGYLTVFPSGQTRPLASSLNFPAGTDVANLVVSKVGADGTVTIHSSASTDLLVDVSGYWSMGGVPY